MDVTSRAESEMRQTHDNHTRPVDVKQPTTVGLVLLFDSHPGPNYEFIIENSSQLFSDKMFLAAGQQLIAVIKPPFDFICSDSMEHDRHGSDRQSGLSVDAAGDECCLRVDSWPSPLPRGFHGAVRHHHSSFSYALSMKPKSAGDGNCPMDFCVTFLANHL